MVNRDVYAELKEDVRKKNKNSHNYQLWGWLLLFVVLIFPFIVLAIIKPYEYIDNFDNIPEPIQIPTSGGTTIVVEGDKIHVNFLAEYDMQGRVLAMAQYGGNIFERLFQPYYLEDNIIRYRDVGIGWGFIAQDDYVNRFTRRSSGRFLYPGFKTQNDRRYVLDRFSWDEIGLQFSHNHLIPANNRIKRLLHGIENGDYVHIKGYLVGLHGDNGYNLVSSLVRDDWGDGACETIYVTDVSRLKSKGN